jgi:cell filamentation protein
MSYSLDSISENCYPGTTILINKFDIRDEAQLAEIEVILVSARAAEWEASPVIDTFDFDHYKKIHSLLFSDLYDWAGQIRTVNISKKGTEFCPAEDIEALEAKIFARLKAQRYFKDMEHNVYVTKIVDFYCSTNYLHPFREGNGRTQRLFLTQLIRSAGYDINFSEVDVDLLMIATIQSAQGVTDLLQQIFKEAIK